MVNGIGFVLRRSVRGSLFSWVVVLAAMVITGAVNVALAKSLATRLPSWVFVAMLVGTTFLLLGLTWIAVSRVHARVHVSAAAILRISPITVEFSEPGREVIGCDRKPGWTQLLEALGLSLPRRGTARTGHLAVRA